jgi:serine/threonine-protein kinase
MDESLPRRLGGYRLIEPIGSGTTGTVYRGEQISLRRTVAIKVLSRELADRPEYVERFRREAHAVAGLNHPNVISCIDAGEAEGIPFFVMEYAAGTTVGALLERGGPMDETRVVSIAVQVARALAHAHEAGLVHRDVKPDNVLLTRDGIAKLCDLGLVQDRPEAARSLGTPHYISPEQARGTGEVDVRSDLYSLGATLYHMLTGRTPFLGNARMVMVQHLSDEPPPIRDLEPEVSEELAAVVKKLMRKDPERRYQTPGHLLEALQAYEESLLRRAMGRPPPVVRKKSPRRPRGPK